MPFVVPLLIPLAINLAVAAALTGISALLTPKPKGPSTAVNPSAFSLEDAEPRTWCYGRAATGGTVKYWETLGTDNKYLWMAVAVHDTPCESFDAFIVDNTTINFTANAATNVFVNGATPRMWRWDKLGAESQTAETNLDTASSKWTSAHRMRGVAYYVWKMEADPKVYTSGIPKPLLILKGRKLWDPRKDVAYGGSGSHDIADETTWEWTANAALALLDYLKGVLLAGKFIGGCRIPIGYIDTDSFAAAANICDEDVALKAGGTEDRYTVNGFVDSVEDKAAIVEAMLLAMGGLLAIRNGKLSLIAGAAQTNVTFPASLTDDDLAGDLEISAMVSRQDKCNTITSVYPDPSVNYTVVSAPVLTVSAYVGYDGGVTLEKEVHHRFTSSLPTVQRLNKLVLANSREQFTVSAPYKPPAIGISAGDTFPFYSSAAGYSNQKMLCNRREKNADGSVLISARQETDAKYSWSESTEEIAAPTFDTNSYSSLPGALSAPTITSLAQNGPAVTVKWDALTSPYLSGYDILAGPLGDVIGNATALDTNRKATDFTTTALAAGNYTVFVRGVDVYGQNGSAASGNLTVAHVGGTSVVDFYTIVTDLGFTGVKFCEDAGSATSYSGSGQTFSDLSGNGTDFYRGTSSSSESLDPTFNGSAGNLTASTYWSSNGDDMFTLTASNPAWLQTWHKAGGKFTIVGLCYVPNTSAGNWFIIRDGALGFNTAGFAFAFITNSGTLQLQYYVDGASGHDAQVFDTGAVSVGWHFVGISVDEAGNLIIFFDNGATGTTGSIVSDAGTDAADTLQMFQNLAGYQWTSGGRIAFMAGLNGVALSSASFATLYRAVQTRRPDFALP